MDVRREDVTVQASHKNVALGGFIEEVLAPSSDILISLRVYNNLSADQFVLFDQGKSEVDVV
ncbi:hypothetical protein, partial [Streptomyces europaeiscabiei]